MFDFNKDKKQYDILWDEIGLFPSIQLKFGIKKKVFPLTKQFTKKRSNLYYINKYVELSGNWDNSPGFGSLLSLKLKNISNTSIKIARLVFPAENGLDNFLKGFKPGKISFLRNGYQSWSTSRSYRLKDKPLRPWLQLISLTSSNMSNLPSNTPGVLSSEMYSLISDLRTGNSFLVAQSAPFNQFFYIRLKLYTSGIRRSYFELVYDFGRKMIMPGETIKLDGIVMALGEIQDLQNKYFSYINDKMKIKVLETRIKGWSTWYYYFNKISAQTIYDNLAVINKKKIDIDFIQIDDGYQKYVGDWLKLTPSFNGRMKKIADSINSNGYRPGLWIAPFIADKKSDIIREFPDYILRNEYGRPIIAGYNVSWPGKYYYALDITNPRFEEYLRKVIRTIVHDWGYSYLKLDFLFAGCMTGGNHHDFKMSRAEVLRYGLNIIKEEAGDNVILVGCGMPISTGIGLVDIMRVGPDTAPFWTQLSGAFLRTGAMIGVRNSIRNFMARSEMNKTLWINDPDCLMIRKKKTKLNQFQRQSQINAIIISGGILLYSDDFAELSNDILDEIKTINKHSQECFKGNAISVDLMEQALPEIFYNTSGYIGIFNFKNRIVSKLINFNNYNAIKTDINEIQDIWTKEIIRVRNNTLEINNMPAFSSKLYKILR